MAPVSAGACPQAMSIFTLTHVANAVRALYGVRRPRIGMHVGVFVAAGGLFNN